MLQSPTVKMHSLPPSSRRRAAAVVPSESSCAQSLATTSRLRPTPQTGATLSHAHSHRSISLPTAARLAVATVTLPVTDVRRRRVKSVAEAGLWADRQPEEMVDGAVGCYGMWFWRIQRWQRSNL
ncbi:transcriptional regulator [Striga asiatica]|uniref:Transcriptional regulator n=1 Tax=Striga asiatica TaxID=4170 RepID=A0A5A7QYZ0_STRAF|nr:transcriptional regulator [Striga asiatica]